VEWNQKEFLSSVKGYDGGMLLFKSKHPKWSYAKTSISKGKHLIDEVAEKVPISDNATVGIYYWAKGKDFVKYAEQMIKADVRTNGEFYVCPVFNEAIKDGKRFMPFFVDKMCGLGDPESVKRFESA
jgi:hypothetical protein